MDWFLYSWHWISFSEFPIFVSAPWNPVQVGHNLTKLFVHIRPYQPQPHFHPLAADVLLIRATFFIFPLFSSLSSFLPFPYFLPFQLLFPFSPVSRPSSPFFSSFALLLFSSLFHLAMTSEYTAVPPLFASHLLPNPLATRPQLFTRKLPIIKPAAAWQWFTRTSSKGQYVNC